MLSNTQLRFGPDHSGWEDYIGLLGMSVFAEAHIRVIEHDRIHTLRLMCAYSELRTLNGAILSVLLFQIIVSCICR
jgi:hypothetical protein